MSDSRPIFSGAASEISDDALGMVLYTNQKQDDLTWARRGLVDSFYIDPRAGLVSVGVDQRDIIDVPTDHKIMLIPKLSATV